MGEACREILGTREDAKWEGIWCVSRMTKDQCAYKIMSDQVSGTKFCWRGAKFGLYQRTLGGLIQQVRDGHEGLPTEQSQDWNWNFQGAL